MALSGLTLSLRSVTSVNNILSDFVQLHGYALCMWALFYHLENSIVKMVCLSRWWPLEAPESVEERERWTLLRKHPAQSWAHEANRRLGNKDQTTWNRTGNSSSPVVVASSPLSAIVGRIKLGLAFGEYLLGMVLLHRAQQTFSPGVGYIVFIVWQHLGASGRSEGGKGSCSPHTGFENMAPKG